MFRSNREHTANLIYFNAMQFTNPARRLRLRARLSILCLRLSRRCLSMRVPFVRLVSAPTKSVRETLNGIIVRRHKYLIRYYISERVNSLKPAARITEFIAALLFGVTSASSIITEWMINYLLVYYRGHHCGSHWLGLVGFSFPRANFRYVLIDGVSRLDNCRAYFSKKERRKIAKIWNISEFPRLSFVPLILVRNAKILETAQINYPPLFTVKCNLKKLIAFPLVRLISQTYHRRNCTY